MKDVLMMVHTMGNLLPSDNDRYTYLAEMLTARGANVEIVTSDFEHHKKKYRDINLTKNRVYTVTYLHENPYQKNVSLKRIEGHLSFAKRLKKYLKTRKKPDVIYCAVPPTVSAYEIAQYAKKNGIRFIVDVQDLWPESFRIALGNGALVNAALSPLSFFVNSAYHQADVIAAVSETFVERAAQNNTKAHEKISVFLGTDGALVEKALNDSPDIIKPENEFWLGYVGNIGASYDFLNVFKALKVLKNDGIKNIRFIIIGDGNLREEIEKYAAEYYPDTVITGYKPYAEMMKLLSACDIAVNPIIAGTASSVVNKVGDYAAIGLPVINTQDNKEYRGLVESYNIGLNTNPGDAKDIADKIKTLYLNDTMREIMGKNNRRLFEEKFDRRKTYGALVDAIMEN